MTLGVGTACWIAPEVIRSAKGSEKSDVYSFGIILWEIATRQEVYKDLSYTQIIAGVRTIKTKKTLLRFHLNQTLFEVFIFIISFWKVANDSLRPDRNLPEVAFWSELMQSCWEDKPEKRPVFAEVLRQLMIIGGEEFSYINHQLPLGRTILEVVEEKSFEEKSEEKSEERKVEDSMSEGSVLLRAASSPNYGAV